MCDVRQLPYMQWWLYIQYDYGKKEDILPKSRI